MRWITSLLLILPFAQDDHEAKVRAALEDAGKKGYSFEVMGRYVRSGVWDVAADEKVPLLFSRIRNYCSVRYQQKLLFKGPAGLWKEYGEALGEEVEHPDSEAANILDTLWTARPPHTMVLEALDRCTRRVTRDRGRFNRTNCDIYIFRFEEERLKTYLQSRIRKAVFERRMEEPTEVKWKTLRGTLKVYVNRKTGDLVHVADLRSVKIHYRGSGVASSKVYKVEISFNFTEIGNSTADIPDKVKERLGIKPKKK